MQGIPKYEEAMRACAVRPRAVEEERYIIQDTLKTIEEMNKQPQKDEEDVISIQEMGEHQIKMTTELSNGKCNDADAQSVLEYNLSSSGHDSEEEEEPMIGSKEEFKVRSESPLRLKKVLRRNLEMIDEDDITFMSSTASK